MYIPKIPKFPSENIFFSIFWSKFPSEKKIVFFNFLIKISKQKIFVSKVANFRKNKWKCPYSTIILCKSTKKKYQNYYQKILKISVLDFQKCNKSIFVKTMFGNFPRWWPGYFWFIISDFISDFAKKKFGDFLLRLWNFKLFCNMFVPIGLNCLL